MKLKFWKAAGPVVAVSVAALVFASCASHSDTHNGHHSSGESSIKLPDRAAEIFVETDKHLQSLATAIKSKDPRAVHEHDAAS